LNRDRTRNGSSEPFYPRNSRSPPTVHYLKVHLPRTFMSHRPCRTTQKLFFGDWLKSEEHGTTPTALSFFLYMVIITFFFFEIASFQSCSLGCPPPLPTTPISASSSHFDLFLETVGGFLIIEEGRKKKISPVIQASRPFFFLK